MKINAKSEIRNLKQARMTEIQNPKRLPLVSRPRFSHLDSEPSDLFRISNFGFRASPPSAAILLAVLFFAGCATGPRPLPICPGKATIEEALGTLAARAQTAVPLQARGEAFLEYHVPDKKLPDRQNLLLQLRFSPPADIYIQGGVSVSERVVIMGSNREQFWLALSPREISSYYIGQWDEVQDFDGLLMSPQVVFEAFGFLAGPESEPNATGWTLENEGPYDILTRRDESGRIVRRAYVYACDYHIHKIEYFDPFGDVIAVAQFAGYESVEEFSVPTRIRVVSTAPDGRKDSMDITLHNPRTTTISERQRALFTPPPADRYENIYRYEAGQWVPQ
jgi:hypothetical protein